jgi:hypothetical protein
LAGYFVTNAFIGSSSECCLQLSVAFDRCARWSTCILDRRRLELQTGVDYGIAKTM